MCDIECAIFILYRIRPSQFRASLKDFIVDFTYFQKLFVWIDLLLDSLL